MRAAVDVGTNTVRALIGQSCAGRVVPGRYFRQITRLGGGFGTDARLAPPARERTLAALREIAALLRASAITQIRAVGTAVLRRAVDGEAFVEEVRAETGIPLEIIDGEEEARLTARGVLSALDPRPPSCLIIDIGGGSTEFVLWREGPLLHRSYPLGVVRLAEDHPGKADQQERIGAMLAALRTELTGLNFWAPAAAPDCRLIGTAGTVTTLAALSLAMTEYDWRRINNLTLDGGELQRLMRVLAPLSVEEREALPGMEKGRGDLIVPGLATVLAVLDLFGRQSLTVSDFGLLEGVLLSQEREPESFLTPE